MFVFKAENDQRWDGGQRGDEGQRGATKKLHQQPFFLSREAGLLSN